MYLMWVVPVATHGYFFEFHEIGLPSKANDITLNVTGDPNNNNNNNVNIGISCEEKGGIMSSYCKTINRSTLKIFENASYNIAIGSIRMILKIVLHMYMQ